MLFVNTARGPIVVEKDLIAALKNGVIFAAGVDVTDPEPSDSAGELLRLPNLVVALHLASATVGTRSALAEICANNLLAGLTGQPLPAWVNPEVEGKRRREDGQTSQRTRPPHVRRTQTSGIRRSRWSTGAR
jgi:glyoxylate reductase